MSSFNKKSSAFSRFADRLARWAIAAAGVVVIGSLFAMLVLIVVEAAPLFLPASQRAAGHAELPEGVRPDRIAGLGVESDLFGRATVVGVLLRDGRGGLAVQPGGASRPFALSPLPGAPEKAALHRVETRRDGKFSVLWDDGTLTGLSLNAGFKDEADGAATAEPAFVKTAETKLDPSRGMPLFAMLRGDETARKTVAVYADGTVTEHSLRPGKGLLGRGKSVEGDRRAVVEPTGSVISAALNEDGSRLYLGTDGGEIVSLDLSGDSDEDIRVDTTPAFRDRRAITALVFLNGDYAVAAGDDLGGVSVWFPRREGGEFRLRRSMEWEARGWRTSALAASGRDRGFVALDDEGGVRWLYSTNGRDLLDIPGGKTPATALAVNARADCLALLGSGGVDIRRLDASYPEAGWSGFFRKLLYEGYDAAAYVWQSTGSDASEPKLSLAPLIWGSLKAAAYALLFATPLALAAAVYLSQFASREWRARLKPAVEMLAAAPSVVIGFLAALWLAPLLEKHMSFFASHWHYDQRNALVIAIAMGFAVIPTIFSLAEDALSAVPPSLTAASLALGASKWQTVRRVVVPSASPGMFTAVMLGLGRAVGETMIVLMAAGNTPIMSLSPFNGMRTLSANIAVEMPEAPVGGTLYRTLFLCALLLFVLTLVINTAAEMFRRRLRQRYGRL